jgi:FKBP-type peptidyl-prolyl cis-trans isomerase
MMRIVCALALALVVTSCSGAEEAAAECVRDVIESDTGLRYEDVECGSGEEAAGGDSVTIEYRAESEEGQEFASSDDQGGEFVFALGRGQVITGLDEGVRSMRQGGTRRMTIPPDLAYGEAGFPPEIGPGETVVYEVTLLGVAGD